MLRRATISEVKNGSVSRADGYLVVTMRAYPRFLSKQLIDDYRQSLSPQKDLFERYREAKKKIGDQNQAFELAKYQQIFALGPEGMQDLLKLSLLSKTKDVYLICQCARNERCHVDLLLLIAENKFGATIDKLPFSYSEFRLNLGSN